MNKRMILILCLVFVLIFLVACGQGKEKEEEKKTPVIVSTPEATEVKTKEPTPEPTDVPVFTTVEPGTGLYHGGIISDDPYTYEAFDVTTHDSSAVTLVDTDTAAMQFFATTTFNEVAFICPSMGNNIGNLTLSLYAWQGSYELTVVSTPIASKEFVDYNDNSWLPLTFEAQVDGEYLLVASDPVENVGVWKTDDDFEGIRSYVNGVEVQGAIKNRIKYTNKPTNLFYKLSDE